MRIKVARSAGFCKGVRRALDIVRALSESGEGPIHTDGPLIHNPQIVSALKRAGVAPLKKGVPPSRGLIVIRAHGVSPERREQLSRIGLPIRDATCPDVARVQGIVKKYAGRGYTVIVVGDRGHAEVEGLIGFCGGRGMVVSGLSDAGRLSRMGRVCVVAQTTQDLNLFRDIVELIKKRASECIVCETVCRSTRERQKEAMELARGVDAMVVVGARNSANTVRLAEICARAGVPVFHVECERELRGQALARFSTIGVTAGASTPEWVITRVVEKLRRIGRTCRARKGARK